MKALIIRPPMTRHISTALAGLVLGALSAQSAGAQTSTSTSPASRSRSTARSVAPAPIPPNTVSRTDDGGVTIRAVRIAEPLHVDGKLDEEIYNTILPI